jgi:ATP-binding cassette, subfamily B, bacterial
VNAPASVPLSEQRPLDIVIIRRLFAHTRPHRGLRNGLIALVLLRAVQLPIVTWAVAAVISGPVAHHDRSRAIWGALGFVAFVLFTEYCFVHRIRLALRLGEAVVHDLRNELYAHLLRMPIAFFKRTPVGKLIGRVTSDIDSVRIGVQDVAFVSTVQAGTMLVSAVLMAYYDWTLFLVVLVMAPILWSAVRHFKKKLSAAYRAASESFSRVTATLAESVTGIKEIQGFVRQDVNGGLFGQLIYDHSKYNMGAARHQAVFLPLLEFNGQLFLSILLVVGGYRALGGDVGLASLIQFLFLSNAFFAAIPILGNQYNQALTAMAGAERVFTLLDDEPEWQDAADVVDLQALRGRVEFEDVGFEYEPGRPVLHGVSFVAQPGQTLALVGHTGSGKTSIVNLVAKLYLPSSGRILIDGRDVLGVSSRSLHGQIASVTQENFLFSGTVIENIRLGKPDADDTAVLAAVGALDVLDLFEELPNGFQTVVGERGSGLSLGQRQLVCFARAMLADPRILILDEATSSVDALTESRLQAALARLLRGRTSFVVAHRLSTIRHADQVLVLSRGQVIERGTHTELLRRGGEYADMYRQFVTSADGDVMVAH